MTSWKTIRIGDLGRVVTGRTPPKNDPAYFGGEVDFLTPTDIGDRGRIRRTARNLSPFGVQKLSRCLVPRGVSVSCIGWKMGKSVLIERPTVTNQQMNSIIVDEAIADSVFVYYAMCARRREIFELGSGGSRTPILNKGDFERLPFSLPEIVEQRAITSILGVLDDKIGVNERMSATLETMGRTIFEDWFIKFGPTHAKARERDSYLTSKLWDLFPASLDDENKPQGWSLGRVSELVEVNPEAWSTKNHPEEIEYVDLANTKWGTIKKTQRLRWGRAPVAAKRILRVGDTIVGTVRPGNGSFAYVGCANLTGSAGFAVLRPQRPQYRELVYFCLTHSSNIERLADLADGTTYPTVDPNAVAATRIAMAGDAIVGHFAKCVSPLVELAEHNKRQNQMLAGTRDILLPKLMSGEIGLREAEKAVEAVT